MGRRERFTYEELMRVEKDFPEWDDVQLAKFFKVSPTAIYNKRKKPPTIVAEKISPKDPAKTAWLEIEKSITTGKFKAWHKFQALVQIVNQHFEAIQ